MKSKAQLWILVVAAAVAFLPLSAMAYTVASPYDGNYTATSLGSVPDLPTLYGGVTFLDNNNLLIGGGANTSSGQLYSIGVTRGAGNHITGFSGSATLLSDGAYNDGGLQYGPGGVLFYTRYPTNEIGEVKPGSSTTDKVVSLSPLGVFGSVGGLGIVPAGFPGAGDLKILSYSGGGWYTATLSPDGFGTYDISAATNNFSLGGGPEGVAWVPTGSPLFTTPSVLIAEYGAGKVVTYQLDSSGNPTGSGQDFITGLTGVEGAVIDPLTGDFLFSTFGGGNQIIEVNGFNAPAVPLPPTVLLLGSGLAGLGFLRRKWGLKA